MLKGLATMLFSPPQSDLSALFSPYQATLAAQAPPAAPAARPMAAPAPAPTAAGGGVWSSFKNFATSDRGTNVMNQLAQFGANLAPQNPLAQGMAAQAGQLTRARLFHSGLANLQAGMSGAAGMPGMPGTPGAAGTPGQAGAPGMAGTAAMTGTGPAALNVPQGLSPEDATALAQLQLTSAAQQFNERMSAARVAASAEAARRKASAPIEFSVGGRRYFVEPTTLRELTHFDAPAKADKAQWLKGYGEYVDPATGRGRRRAGAARTAVVRQLCPRTGISGATEIQ
jgi:hypothetical protein